MARSFAGARAWLTVSVVSAACVVGCGDDDAANGGKGRFTPGEHDLAGKLEATEECEAGVCSPKAAGSTDDVSGGRKQGKPGACEKKTSCAVATDLGVVRGDTGGDVRSRQGVGSEFFSIDVTEERSWYEDPFPLRVTFTLVSPKSTNYDLFVYEDCAGATESSEKPAGDTDKIAKSWGDSIFFPNGTDDRKTLRVEVRKVSQSCDPDDEWTLLVQGNAQ